MPCYSLLSAWRSATRGVSGKQKITFDRRLGVGFELKLPCGQCRGCRLERSRQWAMRCVHEASLWERNCFITLTYDEGHLPDDGSLNKKHFQDFMKRLRSRFSGQRIRFYHCGEYGEKFGRPHYHACLFGFDFADKVLFSESDGTRLYESASLSDIWGHGFCSIGDVTFESAAYVARYILKKITGDRAIEHYMACDARTGEIVVMQPEYTTMSRRPGIGRGWFDKFGDETYRDDFVVLRGRKMKPTRFYDGIYEAENPEGFAAVKRSRILYAREHSDDSTPERLRVREVCAEARLSRLVRSFEHGS